MLTWCTFSFCFVLPIPYPYPANDVPHLWLTFFIWHIWIRTFLKKLVYTSESQSILDLPNAWWSSIYVVSHARPREAPYVWCPWKSQNPPSNPQIRTEVVMWFPKKGSILGFCWLFTLFTCSDLPSSKDSGLTPRQIVFLLLNSSSHPISSSFFFGTCQIFLMPIVRLLCSLANEFEDR